MDAGKVGRSPLAMALLAAGVAAGVGFLVGVGLDLLWLRLWTKAVPVLCLGVWLLGRPGRAARLAAAGMVASAVGDLFLEHPNLPFVGGMAAFAVAHLLYVAAFVSDGRRLAAGRAVPFAVWIGGLVGYCWSGLGPLQIPVAVYGCVIGAMMWRASARLGDPAVLPALARAGAIGAVLFAVSDSLIALKLVGAVFTGQRALIILLYWAGQVGIAWGVGGGRRGRR